MHRVADINPRVIEALYTEALVLADAARSRFDQLRGRTGDSADAHGRIPAVFAEPENVHMVEVTCEALRTTTRVMHCLAWLLNHRAWLAGQISTVQLRRHGRLVSHFPASDVSIVSRLPGDLADLVGQSERLYARIQRLELAWRDNGAAAAGAIERLRDRLAQSTLRTT